MNGGLQMRKTIVAPQTPRTQPPAGTWIDLEKAARAEITSEDPAHPIESALAGAGGWQASASGRQEIRLLFDGPQRVRRVRLEFVEQRRERTQEFALSWQQAGSDGWRPLVRQQF